MTWHATHPQLTLRHRPSHTDESGATPGAATPGAATPSAAMPRTATPRTARQRYAAARTVATRTAAAHNADTRPSAAGTAAAGAAAARTATALGAAVDWPLWGTSARIVVTDAVALTRARQIADRIVGDIEQACSRFRPDSEVSRISGCASEGVEVSDMLAALVERALIAAHDSDGDVDPTLGGVLDDLGYDRDVELLPHAQHGDEASFSVSAAMPRDPGWRRVSLVDRRLFVPDDLRLDLRATAKAIAADLCATAIAEELHCGALVALGGDIATAGPSREAAGWTVAVRDLPRDPEATVTLADGFALATSSTQKRRWMHGGRQMQHILDPRLGLPSPPVWRSVTVAAHNCYRANVLSTAAIVRGRRAVEWLAKGTEPARLVDTHGNVIHLNGWPEEQAREVEWRRAG